VGADQSDDGEVPPDKNPDRRDDQDGTGEQAAGPGDSRAETRTRQEYYSDLRVTVSTEESAAARQATAEEQAASEKWQEKVTESRSIWGKYQSKWPPAERPPVDRSEDAEGSWRGDDGDSFLGPADNSRVEAECDRIANLEKERISPAMRAIESQDPDRHLVGFDRRLKDHDRIKEKVYGMIKESGFTLEDALSHMPDANRYTFGYREAHYTQGVWADIERLKREGFKLHILKNFWSDDQYKGINSQWIEPDSGHRFEVQFHTRISFEAKELTHPAYQRLRTKKADGLEELVLEAFQRKVTADVPVPPGAADIPDYYPERGTDAR
jgi:hypothetical protein